jgi:hypothetical protein
MLRANRLTAIVEHSKNDLYTNTLQTTDFSVMQNIDLRLLLCVKDFGTLAFLIAITL